MSLAKNSSGPVSRGQFRHLAHYLRTPLLVISKANAISADVDERRRQLSVMVGQYKSGKGASTSVSDGGSVEVFATVAQAQHRFAYLQTLSTSGNALFAEYEYLDGVAILRISAQLTPDQAKAYQAAFKALQ